MGQPRRTNHDAPRPSLQVRLERDLETALRLEVVLIHAAWTVREVLGGRATDRLLVARLDRDDRKAVQEVVDTTFDFGGTGTEKSGYIRRLARSRRRWVRFSWRHDPN